MKYLLRTRRYYADADMIGQFKTHILCLLEMHNGAIFHACDAILHKLDRVQSSFIRELGLIDDAAFLEHNLDPLPLRKNIAILSLIHRATLNEVPPVLKKMFGAVRINRLQVRNNYDRQIRNNNEYVSICKIVLFHCYKTYSNILFSKFFLLFLCNFLLKNFVFNIGKLIPG